MAQNNNIPVGPVLTPVLTNECELSVSYIAEDNLTYINYVERDLVQCDEINLNADADFWNCNLCGSDEKYSQPVIAGDIVREQYTANNPEFLSYKAYLFDANGVIIEDTNGIALNLITDGFTNKYLNVVLTVDNIPADCFYFKLVGFTEVIDAGVLATCVAAQMIGGMGAKEADLHCRMVQSENTSFYSELYRKTETGCEDTLLVKGVYPYYDCDGNFYGTPQTGADQHELTMRIPGNIERSEYNFEETLVFNTRRASKQSESFVLRTDKLPPYVVAKLAKIFNSKYLIIDGVYYKGGAKLTKNFDEGRMWIINQTIRTECDEIDFLCY